METQAYYKKGGFYLNILSQKISPPVLLPGVRGSRLRMRDCWSCGHATNGLYVGARHRFPVLSGKPRSFDAETQLQLLVETLQLMEKRGFVYETVQNNLSDIYFFKQQFCEKLKKSDQQVQIQRQPWVTQHTYTVDRNSVQTTFLGSGCFILKTQLSNSLLSLYTRL